MIQNLIEYFQMNRDSRFLERHPTIQGRFEVIEQWLVDIDNELGEITERLEKLEDMAHPKCGLEGFDGYQPLVDRINKLEIVVGTLKKND